MESEVLNSGFRWGIWGSVQEIRQLSENGWEFGQELVAGLAWRNYLRGGVGFGIVARERGNVAREGRKDDGRQERQWQTHLLA